VSEQTPTNASDPSVDGQPRPTDPVSRLAALTQRPVTTSIFGRRAAPEPDPAPAQPTAIDPPPAPVPDAAHASQPTTSIFGSRLSAPTEPPPAEAGEASLTKTEPTAPSHESAPIEAVDEPATDATQPEESIARMTDAIALPAPEPAPTSAEPWEALPASAPDPFTQVTSAPRLGRLAPVSAADLWDGTAAMSTWLSDEPEALADALDLSLRDVTTTAPGRVRGVAASDASPVSIVCEVGPSSDEAFAALLATASLQDGGTVVWIAGDLDATHGATLSWLNRSTSPRFLFVKAAGVRIGESAAAPTFEVVVRPARATDAAPSEPSQASPGASAGRRAEDHEGG
jgi:hypothetical protein